MRMTPKGDGRQVSSSAGRLLAEMTVYNGALGSAFRIMRWKRACEFDSLGLTGAKTVEFSGFVETAG